MSRSLGISIQKPRSYDKCVSVLTTLAGTPAKTQTKQLLLAHATVDAMGGFQSSSVYLKKGQEFVLEPEGRIHLASDQVDDFARVAKPLIVKYAKRRWSPEIKRRYKLPKLDEARIFYRGWTGPEGELQRSDMLEHCKLREDLNWGALLAVILPVKGSPSSDPLYILTSNKIKPDEMIPIPQKTTRYANRDGWLTFIINDAIVSPYSPSQDGRDFYHALLDAAQALSRDRHQVPQTIETNAPDAIKAFWAFDKAAMAAGAIPVKYKELMALAVAFTTQCPYCIEIHAQRAREAGGSEREIAEVVAVAAALRAGAAITHGTHAFVER